jgi:hypothetical protein
MFPSTLFFVEGGREIEEYSKKIILLKTLKFFFKKFKSTRTIYTLLPRGPNPTLCPCEAVVT